MDRESLSLLTIDCSSQSSVQSPDCNPLNPDSRIMDLSENVEEPLEPVAPKKTADESSEIKIRASQRKLGRRCPHQQPLTMPRFGGCNHARLD